MVKAIGCLHEMDERAWPRCSHSGRAPDACLSYHIPASAAWLLLPNPRPALDGGKGENDEQEDLRSYLFTLTWPVIDGDSTMPPAANANQSSIYASQCLSPISTNRITPPHAFAYSTSLRAADSLHATGLFSRSLSSYLWPMAIHVRLGNSPSSTQMRHGHGLRLASGCLSPGFSSVPQDSARRGA